MPHNPSQSRFSVPPEVLRIGQAIRQVKGRPILVGGWVRDMLLGVEHGKDFDIEAYGVSIQQLRSVLKRIGPVHSVGRQFGVLKLKHADAEFDVSVPRRESNIGKGHRGFHVETDPDMSFDEAAARRDFTMNAIGYAFLEDVLLDPCGGEADLRAGVLRHVGPAFGEDPLRVMRAMQFAGRFRFTIAPETLAICRSQDLHELPRERVWEEFRKLLLRAPNPSLGLAYIPELGMLPYFPELDGLHADNGAWNETLAMADSAATLRTGDDRADRTMMMAALCHRMTPFPAAADGFMQRLTNERSFIDAVLALLAELPMPEKLYARRESFEPGELRRLALRQPLPPLLRAAAAQHHALHGSAAFKAGQWLRAQADELGIWDQAPQPLLMGRHLLERGMSPGPEVGGWVREAFERQLDGEINSLDEALHWVEERRRAGGVPSKTAAPRPRGGA